MLRRIQEAQVSKRVMALVLLAVLGAASAFVMRPRAVQAEEPKTCIVPKGAGTYRGGGVFEDAADGTLTNYALSPASGNGGPCALLSVVFRR
jgi:hypothetical protein